jgi:predicted amidophosphoribosyltransferase
VSVQPRVRELVAAAGDLLLGAVCLACGRPWWGVCADCRADLAGRRCYLSAPDPCPTGFPVTVTSSPYDELLASLITAHKDQQALTLTPFLGARLAASVESLLATLEVSDLSPVVLAPVPSSAPVVRDRGLDASLAMARHAARVLRRAGRPVRAARLLRQGRALRDQAGLTAAERQANLSCGLRPTRAAASTRDLVVVVDDVVTTGSSLTEATRTLAAAGVRVLGAATVAATVRHRSRPQQAAGRPLSGD